MKEKLAELSWFVISGKILQKGGGALGGKKQFLLESYPGWRKNWGKDIHVFYNTYIERDFLARGSS